MIRKINKKIIIIVLILLIAAGGVFLLLQNQAETIVPGKDFKAPTSEKIKVGDKVVNNFYKNNNYTYPTGNTVITENGDYQIAYLANEKVFTVRINSDDAVSRGLAEQDFIKKLGVTQEFACGLSVREYIFPKNNNNNIPQATSLSFCK